MNDLEILECLRRNTKDDLVYKFTKEIFEKEMRGDYEWRSDYNKIINKHAKDVKIEKKGE